MFFKVAALSLLGYLVVFAPPPVPAHVAAEPLPRPLPAPSVPPPAPTVVVVPATASTTRVVDVRLADLEETGAISRSARIVRAMRDGARIGYKLYAIRPGSLLAAVGFENGDTLRAINDVPLVSDNDTVRAIKQVRRESPDLAPEVYRTHRDPDHFDLDIERRGERVRIVVLLH